MNSQTKRIFVNPEDKQSINWKSCLKNELENIQSQYIEIDCGDQDITCKVIREIIDISNIYSCEITIFHSTSAKTIVSCQSLGYPTHFILKKYSNYAKKTNNKNLDFSKTNFHHGTLRSGEYLDSPGDLLILGDVNPGAVVSAEGNVIIWGRLLGIAHAGSKGNSQAKISALQLRPVQLRIANKVARGPQERPQPSLAEEAKIDSGKIIITPLENI
tara:strand:- start:194 stop:841 length:648 start_codon:yes stop_codon:yes gene_type:complete